MGVTSFGKILRKRRIDSSEILGDMAKRLDVSASYLSSIETVCVKFRTLLLKKLQRNTIFQRWKNRSLKKHRRSQRAV